ncbi:MAG: glycosyltransferase family 2 protein [Deltaproteobacteria bacterium]|nr:glycosyltransferase family 2 protein [Deltaproteobacteria bacterium]
MIVLGYTLAILIALPALFYAGYLFLLTLASFFGAKPRALAAPLRFGIVVPAHNESAGIAGTVQSLLALDYPRDRFDVFVIADNCSDDTAAVARAAGAKVLERQNKDLRGKGYALTYAFDHLQVLGADKPDAAVVIDADTLVSKNLLRAFSAAFASGARAAQADYAVSNPNASWRTRLMRIALAMFHIVRSLGREALGVSCGLRGNGMAFSLSLLAEVPHAAFSVVEDLEYGIALGQRGYRVFYVHDAHVYGEMVPGEKASRSQRERWERGRDAMKKKLGRTLLKAGLAERSLMLFDLAMDVLVPPLSRIAVLAVLALAGAAAAVYAFQLSFVALLPSLLAAFCLSTYVMRGWWLSGTGLRGLFDLAMAPAYVVWKLSLPLLRGKKAKKADEEWVRTARKGERAEN